MLQCTIRHKGLLAADQALQLCVAHQAVAALMLRIARQAFVVYPMLRRWMSGLVCRRVSTTRHRVTAGSAPPDGRRNKTPRTPAAVSHLWVYCAFTALTL